MKDTPLLIPILLVFFVSVGLARVKTIAITGLFALAFVYGYRKGEKLGKPKREVKVRDTIFLAMLLISLFIILFQILILGEIPLLDPQIRSHLNPKMTMLTYLLGLPSSVYLFMKGRKIALLYPILVSLYAYRTPILVSLIALTVPYLETQKDNRRVIIVTISGLFLILAVSYLRGSLTFLTRIQGTTSVLDVIVKRCSLSGFYKGKLQWTGVTSYFVGGLGPRSLIAKYLGVSGVTITATLIGGMYLDFGLLSIIEITLLGLYYGITKRLTSEVGKAFYYSTLAYGIVGVETGILDLPTYLMFLIGAIIAWREIDGDIRKSISNVIANVLSIGKSREG
ncbi:oligosaccharide repeat unit polymerase family protein [Pyrococcus abyssi]|uniref:Predicted archaeal membrane protein, DUF70 family n=1 Tax=Pyrococcus abyssi (strain GE5 / Orsay) TaxID=272844 RepID=Q9V2I0_PYRAB|nr:hypothetical protein [Pyrococcus abyssi]CAB49018.1 Predicted archaeal membrane protein, DUF70 family [Pyrococcus abyssi GE5]CCE69470.1 TPA: hypothetical protein PAB0054 [Pyrococcus abyssi GE5]